MFGRSQFIENCVKQAFEKVESEDRIGELLLDLMEIAAKKPEFVGVYKEVFRKA